MRDRPHPEQGYRAAMGILSLSPRYGPERTEAASVTAILKSGLDRANSTELPKPTPAHANIRRSSYYQ